jgi:hypothetical protein
MATVIIRAITLSIATFPMPKKPKKVGEMSRSAECEGNQTVGGFLLRPICFLITLAFDVDHPA